MITAKEFERSFVNRLVVGKITLILKKSMNSGSAIDRYRAVCKTYQDAVDSYDEPDYRKKVQSETQKIHGHVFKNYSRCAESNDPALWHVIGIGFNMSRGSKEHDETRGLALRFQRAAEAGHAPAMVNLGLCLMRPEPALDMVAAVNWFRKAADTGYAGGMIWLGFAYREGDGVPEDYRESVQWFIKAVEAGDSHSTIHVGRMYACHLSAPAEAVSWFLRAAKAAHAESYL